MSLNDTSLPLSSPKAVLRQAGYSYADERGAFTYNNDSAFLYQTVDAFDSEEVDFSLKDVVETTFANSTGNGTSIDIDSKSPSTGSNHMGRHLDVVRSRRSSNLNADRTTLLNTWIGIVRSIDEAAKQFTATYRDQTHPDNPEEEGVFEFADLSMSDCSRLAEGSVFYWTIGYSYRGATKSKFTEIHLRRVAKLTHQELQQAENQADEYWNLLSGD